MAKWVSANKMCMRNRIKEKKSKRKAGKENIRIDVVRNCVYVESDINANG